MREPPTTSTIANLFSPLFAGSPCVLRRKERTKQQCSGPEEATEPATNAEWWELETIDAEGGQVREVRKIATVNIS